jgi:hypothetical protein
MAGLLENAGTGLDASQEESVSKELEALVSAEEEREAREEAGKLPEAPSHEVEREEKEEALPSVRATTVVVVGGGKEREGQGVEEEGGGREEKERVPVAA